MEKDSGLGGGLTVSQLPSPPTGSRNMYLEMIQDKRPISVFWVWVNPLHAFLRRKKSQECNAPSALPQIPSSTLPLTAAVAEGHSGSVPISPWPLHPPGSSRDASPSSHLCCPEGVPTLLAVTQPCPTKASTDLCAHPPRPEEPAPAL